MGKSALHTIASQAQLYKSWKKINSRAVRSKREVSGVDEISVEKFSSNVDANIYAIRQDLLNRRYKFCELLAFTIPKDNGGFRIINIPTVRDRIVQGAVLDFLSEKPIFKSSSNYGFLRGKTVKQAVSKFADLRFHYPYVVKVDLQSFFDTIPRNELIGRVNKKLKFRSVVSLIHDVIDCESAFRTEGDLKKAYKKGLKKGVGIRQGMPLSPFLANLYLDEFDVFVQKKGYKIIRYADDFVVLCSSMGDADRAVNEVVNCLKEIGLSISTEKSDIFNPDQSVEFLGIDCVKYESHGYRLELSNRKLRKLVSNILDFRNIDFCLKNNVKLFSLEKRLDLMISGYCQAYDLCANSQSIKDKLVANKNRTINDILKEGLGVKVDDLNKKQHEFLGLK
ncbi:reverse transcriptase domain-containing protein [Marinobacter sp. M1N3S26]|uniref:reverse transcriptase domain-containing protein n=1 Tax=Marinobacter sp. M1N3S26 TaxID=3382299 RepID=UPI00387B7A9C